MFNLYLAGTDPGADEHIVDIGANRLFSQANEKTRIEKFSALNKNHTSKLLIDSGAFSVAHSGKQIDVDTYIKYINDNDDKATLWVQLDDIPYPIVNTETVSRSSEKSWENYLYMVDKIKSPEKLLALHHCGESYDCLRRMLNTPIDALDGHPCPYIGVAGRHGITSKQLMYYFDDVFKIIKESNNPNVHVHAFGMTVFHLLEMFPFYSADSTSWLKQAIFGNIFTPYGKIGFSTNINSMNRPEHIIHLDDDTRNKVLQYVNDLGYTKEELESSIPKRLQANVDFFHNWCKNYKCTPVDLGVRKLF